MRALGYVSLLMVPLLALSIPAPAASAEDAAAFARRCKAETLALYPESANWADGGCRDKWAQVVASRPIVDAILALAPEKSVRAPSLAEVKARLPGVRWTGGTDRQAVATGALGALEVTAAGTPSAVNDVSLGWAEVGGMFPYDAVEALKVAGVPVETIGCMTFGAGEVGRRLKVSPPGRAPLAIGVHARMAPTGNAWSHYTVSIDPTGRVPTLADVRRIDGEEWAPDCPAGM